MEYKHKEGMIDNRMVDDNHQQGIKRVLQRRSEYNPKDCEGHNGSMKNGWKHGGSHEHKSFKRTGGQLTPRKA